MEKSKIISINDYNKGRGRTSPIFFESIDILDSAKLIISKHKNEIIDILKLDNDDYNKTKKSIEDSTVESIASFIIDKTLELDLKPDPQLFKSISFVCFIKLFELIRRSDSIESLKNNINRETVILPNKE